MKCVLIYDTGARHVLIRGNTRDVLSGFPGAYSKQDRGLWVRRDHLPDARALLEIAGYVSDVIEGEPA